MVRDDTPAPAARFATAVARLAGRAIALAGGDDGPASQRALRALDQAMRAAQDLEQMAARGGDLNLAYTRAARALNEASDAFDRLDDRPRPWVHVVRRHGATP
jgi:hypothetical protein